MRHPRRAGQAAAQADPVVRAAEQLRSTSRRSSSTGARIADKIHITDLHNWAGTLNTESDVNYPCYRPWLTFTVLWDGRVSLCCADFDGRTILGDLQHLDRSRSLERRALPRRAPRSTSRAAAPTSAGPATCRRRTRRSGSPSCSDSPGCFGPHLAALGPRKRVLDRVHTFSLNCRGFSWLPFRLRGSESVGREFA